MSLVTQSELNELISKITETVFADEIILFGSFAYGTPNEDSDIDFVCDCRRLGMRLRKRMTSAFYAMNVPSLILTSRISNRLVRG